MSSLDLILLAGKVAAALTAVGTPLWLFWRYLVRPPLTRARAWLGLLFTRIELIPVMLQMIEEQGKDQQAIKKEMQPNGGASFRDVVERLDSRVHYGEQRSKALLQGLAIAAFEADSAGRCTWASRKFCSLLGLPEERAIGSGWLHGVSGEDVDEVMDEWTRAVAERREFAHSFHAIGDDGTSRMLRLMAFPIYRRNGEVYHFQGAMLHEATS